MLNKMYASKEIFKKLVSIVENSQFSHLWINWEFTQILID